MHVVAFRHVPFEHLGVIAPALDQRGIACHYAGMFDQAPDPPFQGLAAPEVLFHWHGKTFDLPAGAATPSRSWT